MDNKNKDKANQKKELKAVNKKDLSENSSYLFRDNYENDIHTDPQGSWTGVPLDDPYDRPIQDADDL